MCVRPSSGAEAGKNAGFGIWTGTDSCDATGAGSGSSARIAGSSRMISFSCSEAGESGCSGSGTGFGSDCRSCTDAGRTALSIRAPQNGQYGCRSAPSIRAPQLGQTVCCSCTGTGGTGSCIPSGGNSGVVCIISSRGVPACTGGGAENPATGVSGKDVFPRRSSRLQYPPFAGPSCAGGAACCAVCAVRSKKAFARAQCGQAENLSAS